jgi:RNA polymerase sigma-70 factor (ECF subfamily)
MDGLGEPAIETPNPEESLNLRQQRQMILSGLRCLTARERQAVVLRDLESQSTAEVAALLKISEGTVRSLLSTGRIKLRRHIVAALRRPQ